MPKTDELNYRDALAGAVDSAMPAIDASTVLAGSWQEIVPAARASLENQGFVILALGDELRDVLTRAASAMQAFCAAGNSVKDRVVADHGGVGWTPSQHEPAYQPGTVSNLESFDIDRGLADAPDHAMWPDMPGFREPVCDCWRTSLALADAALELIARATGVEPGLLVGSCASRELNTLRLLRYPPDPAPRDEKDVGIAAHTDFECISLLWQNAPGLELRDRDGRWLDAPARPDRLVIMIDDMLETWTNGRLPATGHRVRRTPGERYSLVLFAAVDPGVVVEPLPQFVDDGQPPAYKATEQGAHIEREVSRARALRDAG